MYTVLLLGIEQVTKYGHMYKSAIQEYKASYFKERSSLSLFTRYMIAIINKPGDKEQIVEARTSR